MLTYLASMLGTINMVLYLLTAVAFGGAVFTGLFLIIEKEPPTWINISLIKKLSLSLLVLIFLNVVIPPENTFIQIINGAR